MLEKQIEDNEHKLVNIKRELITYEEEMVQFKTKWTSQLKWMGILGRQLKMLLKRFQEAIAQYEDALWNRLE